MNYLFICSRNQWRSPTAERVFAQNYAINTRSAGTSHHARHTVSAQDIHWADRIFVMEYKHKKSILEKFSKQLAQKKVVVLDIPDNYQYMDTELINILKETMTYYLE
nr:protein tyrosine phosphatase [Acinetobacter sp. Marseille-Q1620]